MIRYDIGDDARSVMRSIDEAVARFDRAVERFLFAVYERISTEVSSRGTRVKGVDYSDAELADVGEIGGARVMAFVVPSQQRDVSDDDKGKTVVYIKPTVPSEEMRFLEANSPWPLETIPFVDPSDARSISRRVSGREIDFRLDQMLDIPSVVKFWVEKKMIRASYSKAKSKEVLMERAFPDGYKVQEDIVWSVLRQEFGIGDDPAAPHWRPALNAAAKSRTEFDLFLRFLLGDDSALKRSQVNGGLSVSDRKRGEAFLKMLGNVSSAKRLGEK